MTPRDTNNCASDAPATLLPVTAKRPSKPGPDPADLSYEKAVERLEEIVARIESGEVGLEDSIALYEEGVALGRHCREVLTKAQQRIEELSREGATAGDSHTEPQDEADEEA